MPGIDPRFVAGVALLDPRLVPIPRGRQILKAVARRRALPAMPSAAVQETERPFWGPHPDPEVAYIEDAFYRPGADFLRRLAGAALGRPAPRSLVKSFQGLDKDVPGWGQLADLFKSDMDPAHLMQGWESVITRLTSALFPGTTQAQVAQGLAVRSALLHRMGQQVAGGRVPTLWSSAIKGVSPSQVEAMAWTRERGLRYMKRLDADARDGLLQVLLDSRQAGDGTGALQRRMFDRFSQLNRDWRRVALTETAFAVQNGQLASVDPADGWDAVWMAAANACPFCLAMNGRRFRVVAADAAHKDGDTQVWTSKTNIGRSPSRWSKKESRVRTKAELWWPAMPAHPNCACRWLMRRTKAIRGAA